MWISGEGEREVKISISSIRSAAGGSGKELGTDLSLFLSIESIKGTRQSTSEYLQSPTIDPSGGGKASSINHSIKGGLYSTDSSIGFIPFLLLSFPGQGRGTGQEASC